MGPVALDCLWGMAIPRARALVGRWGRPARVTALTVGVLTLVLLGVYSAG